MQEEVWRMGMRRCGFVYVEYEHRIEGGERVAFKMKTRVAGRG